MNIAIAVVLVQSFVKKNDLELCFDAYSNYNEVLDCAQLEGDQEIVECLQFIERVEMIESCFKAS